MKLAKEVLQIPLTLEVTDQNTPDILDPIYNRDKIYDRAIVNAEVAIRENDDIMHREIHVISLTREWIKKHFRLDLLPNAPTLQAPARPEKQKGIKVTIPTFEAQPPDQPETVYKHERDMVY